MYNKIEHIVDFSPDLLFLVVGTNDIYDVSVSTEEVANSIFNLAEVIHHQSKTHRIVIVQVLHRHPPSVAVRYPVDVDFYNSQLNKRFCLHHALVLFLEVERILGAEHKGTCLYCGRLPPDRHGPQEALHKSNRLRARNTFAPPPGGIFETMFF